MDETLVTLLGAMDFESEGDPRTKPERRLVVYFVVHAFRDLWTGFRSHREETREWFEREDDPDDPPPFSLLWCCMVLFPELDAEVMRQRFREASKTRYSISLPYGKW